MTVTVEIVINIMHEWMHSFNKLLNSATRDI